MSHITQKFFELLRIAIGNKDGFECLPTDEEWKALFKLANEQSLSSFLFMGLEKVLSQPDITKPSMLFEWIGIQQTTASLNALQNKRAKELTEIFFKHGGFRSCILKGQGTALYYDKPEYRQCGDIDIWIEGDRDKILEFAHSHKQEIGHVDIKHSDISFFDDVPVEVHFMPSWMYCPATNKKLQRFFREKAEWQFANYDENIGFAHTTIDFDLVYSMVHMYRHIFSEGIGLRQLVDYYYILQRSTEEQRLDAFEALCQLKMRSFVGGIMWILMERFGMDANYSLCSGNEKHGKFLLSEIMAAGSFGHFDTRIKQIDHEKRFKRGFSQLKRNLRFVTLYPSEVLWSPFWKLWHWYWRKKKGYL